MKYEEIGALNCEYQQKVSDFGRSNYLFMSLQMAMNFALERAVAVFPMHAQRVLIAVGFWKVID